MADSDSIKLCECGCGQPAPIAKRTHNARGYVAGKPCRFIIGHQKAIDLSGRRFGKLLAVKVVRSQAASKRIRVWECACDCGSRVETRSDVLLCGAAVSCGCNSSDAHSTHGHYVNGRGTPTYHSWRAMLARCADSKHPAWHRYGGRGIRVCDRWRTFENFLADMGERPPDKTLDRYPDNDGNYEPSNCRWATKKEQAANRAEPNGDGDQNCC